MKKKIKTKKVGIPVYPELDYGKWIWNLFTHGTAKSNLYRL